MEWRSYRSELERPGHGEIRPDPINRERMRDRHRREDGGHEAEPGKLIERTPNTSKVKYIRVNLLYSIE